jgi:F-type H+-transporting ATPase subunit delta
VFELIGAVIKTALAPKVEALLRTVLDNGRLAALPEIAAQFQALVNAKSGVSDAMIESAYPIDASTLPGVVTALEQRFGRKLKAQVVVKPELIGGIRVVVGDEVLDTSVRARLEQMKAALVA